MTFRPPPSTKLSVEDRWITVPAELGDVRVRIVRPPDAQGTLPVILYMHGGGMTAVLALMANERGDVRFVQQSNVLPGHRCRHGHRLVRAVRGGPLFHREGDAPRMPARYRAAPSLPSVKARRGRRAAAARKARPQRTERLR
jgi:acetyl esterase/lipase